jgi:hypothetical protein
MADKVDDKVWARKDAQIIAQSSLKVATDIVMGLGASGLDPFTLSNVKKRVKETAAELIAFVYNSADLVVTPKPKSKALTKATLPKPNPAAAKVLAEIIKQNTLPISDDEVKRRTLEWAKSVHKVEQYPQSMESVKEILEWLKK